MRDKDPSEHIWDLMKDIGVAMVVTHSGSGDSVRARPMAASPCARRTSLLLPKAVFLLMPTRQSILSLCPIS